MSITSHVADWARALTWDSVPPPLQRWAAVRVADTIGVIGGARDSRPAAAVLGVARATTGPAPLLFERAEVLAPYAALAHGTLAHVYDYDDTYPESVVHPSSVVLPTALAAGYGASGEQVLLGALAGYEFLARAGAAAGRRFHGRGFHATGVLGTVAAALVAGVASDADQASIVNGMGLAGSMSGGLLEFLSDGTWSKRMHPGWAAHSGILASQLASGGFSGPATILEGQYGLFRAFVDVSADEADAQFADLGERWACLSLQTKFFPCAHVIHPYLELLLAWLAVDGNAAGDIASITCHVAPWAVPIAVEPLDRKRAPANEYDARASLPFALALAMFEGAIAAAAFADDALRRPEVLDAAARVSYVEDSSLDPDFPARLVIRTRHDELIELSSASSVPLLDEEQRVRRKFEINLEPIADEAGRQRVWDAALGLAASRPRELVAACRGAVS